MNKWFPSVAILERYILYTLFICSSLGNLYMGKLLLLKQTPKDEDLSAWVGTKIEDYNLIPLQGADKSLYTLLRNEMNPIFITSFDHCSPCRERELRAWSAFVKSYPEIEPIFIGVEPVPMNKQQIVSAKESLRTYSENVFIDQAGELLRQLKSDTLDAPVLIVVSGSSFRILYVDTITPTSTEHNAAFRTFLSRFSEEI